MPCEVWRTLLEECYEAETAYTLYLAKSCGLVGAGFDQAIQRAEEARRTSQVCEKALLRQEHMHDCISKSEWAKPS